MIGSIRRALAQTRVQVRTRLFAQLAATSLRLASRLTGNVVIGIDYPPSAANVPRYGYGKPPHQRLWDLFERDAARHHETLRAIAGFASELRRIELYAKDPLEPSWINHWLPALDSAAIYGLMRLRAPRLFLEIGSGNSTLFADRARRDGALESQIISIDPQPRADVDRVCDRVIRAPLEAVDLALFGELRAGDILYFDGSHRVFMNSDVAVFFLDVLPALPAGVLVAIHDIYLPNDYSPAIADRYYSEQYMLAAYLLGGADVSIVLPAAHVSRGNAAHMLDELWSYPELAGVERHGDLFWFETR
jgi:hypothetical protein